MPAYSAAHYITLFSSHHDLDHPKSLRSRSISFRYNYVVTVFITTLSGRLLQNRTSCPSLFVVSNEAGSNASTSSCNPSSFFGDCTLKKRKKKKRKQKTRMIGSVQDFLPVSSEHNNNKKVTAPHVIFH